MTPVDPDAAHTLCAVAMKLTNDRPHEATMLLLSAWLALAHAPSHGRSGQAVLLNTGAMTLKHAIAQWNLDNPPTTH